MEEELSPFFGDMMVFVREFEPIVDTSPDTVVCDTRM